MLMVNKCDCKAMNVFLSGQIKRKVFSIIIASFPFQIINYLIINEILITE